MPVYVRRVATSHLLDNILSVTDSGGGGAAVLHWRLRGTRANGDPFELRRSDRMTSRDDIGLTAGFRLLLDLVRIDENVFENATFSGVAVRGRIRATPREDRIQRVEVSVNGGEFGEVDKLTAGPGDEMRFRVTLQKPDARLRVVEMSLVVPDGASGTGLIVVAGGTDFGSVFDCFSYPDICPHSFPGLIQAMEAVPRADDLLVDLTMSSDYGSHFRAQVRHRAVITGRVDIGLTVNP